jgi:glycolate oxidase FAD binding subunit
MGRLGILISASFKIFPAPPATASLRSTLPTLGDALNVMARLMGGPFDLETLDLVPLPDGSVTLLTRIGGPVDVLDARLERLRALVGNSELMMDDGQLWIEMREFAWANEDSLLIKVATTPQNLSQLDRSLHATHAPRVYAAGGNLVWFSWPDSVESAHQLLAEQGMRGLIVRGNASRTLIGAPIDNVFLERVRSALDPMRRFVDFS